MRVVLFAFALILAGPALAAPLPRVTPAQEGFAPDLGAQLRAAMQTHVDEGLIPGAVMLVARHGHVVAEKSVGWRDVNSRTPMTSDTIFRLFSSTKVFTAATALMLVDDGKLKLDEPVTTYIPEFSKLRVWVSGEGDAMVTEPLRRPLTVRDVFAHRGGFVYTGYGDTPVHKLMRARQVEPGRNGDGPASLDEFIARLSTVPLLFQPGDRWEYSVSSDVLGALVQRVSSQPFDGFMAERLLKPLGLSDTGFTLPGGKRDRMATVYRLDGGKLAARDRPTSEPTIPEGGAGLSSTAEDFARFAVMLCNAGILDGKRLLKAQTVASMNVNIVPPGGPAYGLGVGIEMDPDAVMTRGSVGSYGWSGAGQVHFWVDPKTQIVGIFLTQVTPFTLDRDTEMRSIVYGALNGFHS